MRSLVLGMVMCSLTAVFTVAACASSEEVPPPVQETAKAEPTPQPVPAATTPPPKPEAPKCVAKCKADSECASSCPASSSGVHCCDVQTGACYATDSGTCPKAEPPPADPPSGY